MKVALNFHFRNTFYCNTSRPHFVLFLGEVRYGKNGHHMATLMFIDKTLPMWAFFDVYGNTQKIKILG